MVEKDYGEKFITPAKQFIEMINNKVAEVMGYRDTEMEGFNPQAGPCHGCSGTGHEMGDPRKACQYCGGTGKSTEPTPESVEEAQDIMRLAGL